jgi:dihydropyrimidinase
MTDLRVRNVGAVLADRQVVESEAKRVVRGAELGSIADYSPFEGVTLRGWPVWTMLRGQSIARDRKVVGDQGYGRYLREA